MILFFLSHCIFYLQGLGFVNLNWTIWLIFYILGLGFVNLNCCETAFYLSVGFYVSGLNSSFFSSETAFFCSAGFDVSGFTSSLFSGETIVICSAGFYVQVLQHLFMLDIHPFFVQQVFMFRVLPCPQIYHNFC